MGWLIFWVIFGLYVVIGGKRIPTYFNRVEQSRKVNYPYSYAAKGNAHKESAWTAISIAAFWPWYEGGRWIQNYIIKVATAEQRRLKEYEKAERIVEAYAREKAQKEREAFDRELRDEK